jgi:putative OPT family oligopeptide transporter
MIGMVMTAAFVYIALKLGFSLGGSTVAAILGFGILRQFVKNASIIENNINQTVASGVNNASAGIVFTLPALYLMGADFSLLSVGLSAIAGTFLGIVVIIPLRKQMIELERLKFPSGIAVASLLKSPGAGAHQARLLLGGFAISAAVHAVSAITEIDAIPLGEWFHLPAYTPLVVGISFASVGAGLLAGRGGLPFVAGGVLAWWVLSPITSLMGWVHTPADLGIAQWGLADWGVTVDQAYDTLREGILYNQMLRPLGIGILIGGALSGVVASIPALKSAIKSLSSAAQSGAVGGSEELSARALGIAAISALGLLYLSAILSGGLGWGHAFVVALVGALWLVLAGLVVAQATGMTDISPLSGMSLIGVTLMFFVSGGDSTLAIILGVAVCIGIGQCADMMSDLKAGHLIGAQPRRQQLAQLAVGWIGVPVAIGVLALLWGDGDGFGPNSTSGLSAPQGEALKGILAGLVQGGAPLEKYVAGAAVGLALGFHSIRGLGVLIGLAMYLPFEVTLTYGIGCMTALYLERVKSRAWMSDTLVPVAAGLIIGEALTNITAVLIRLAAGGA